MRNHICDLPPELSRVLLKAVQNWIFYQSTGHTQHWPCQVQACPASIAGPVLPGVPALVFYEQTRLDWTRHYLHFQSSWGKGRSLMPDLSQGLWEAMNTASGLCHNFCMRASLTAPLPLKTEGPFSLSFFLRETVGHSAQLGRAVNISLATVVLFQQRQLSARDTLVPAASVQGLCVNVGSPGHRDLRLHIKVTSISGHRPACVPSSERDGRILLCAFLRAAGDFRLSLHALLNCLQAVVEDSRARTASGANASSSLVPAWLKRAGRHTRSKTLLPRARQGVQACWDHRPCSLPVTLRKGQQPAAAPAAQLVADLSPQVGNGLVPASPGAHFHIKFHSGFLVGRAQNLIYLIFCLLPQLLKLRD